MMEMSEMTHTKQFIVNLDDAGYWDSPTQCYAADEIRSLIGKLVKAESERDAALVRCDRLADMISESSNRWQLMFAALREARKNAEWNKRIGESVDKLLGMAGYHEESSSRHQLSLMNFDAIATINKVLGEE